MNNHMNQGNRKKMFWMCIWDFLNNSFYGDFFGVTCSILMNDIQNCYLLKSEAVSIAAGNKYLNEILFLFDFRELHTFYCELHCSVASSTGPNVSCALPYRVTLYSGELHRFRYRVTLYSGELHPYPSNCVASCTDFGM